MTPHPPPKCVPTKRVPRAQALFPVPLFVCSSFNHALVQCNLMKCDVTLVLRRGHPWELARWETFVIFPWQRAALCKEGLEIVWNCRCMMMIEWLASDMLKALWGSSCFSLACEDPPNQNALRTWADTKPVYVARSRSETWVFLHDLVVSSSPEFWELFQEWPLRMAFSFHLCSRSRCPNAHRCKKLAHPPDSIRRLILHDQTCIGK